MKSNVVALKDKSFFYWAPFMKCMSQFLEHTNTVRCVDGFLFWQKSTNMHLRRQLHVKEFNHCILANKFVTDSLLCHSGFHEHYWCSCTRPVFLLERTDVTTDITKHVLLYMAQTGIILPMLMAFGMALIFTTSKQKPFKFK